MDYIAAQFYNMLAIITQILGYLAFIFLAISLLVNNDIKFRWINSFGCLSFVLYGIILNAPPIILTNAVLLVINIYSLARIYKRKEKFDIAEFRTDDALAPHFLDFHKKDIDTYFPSYIPVDKGNEIRFFVLRDVAIANMFSATLQSDGGAVVNINYTIPKYRDFKVGKFLFEEEKEFLRSKGVKRVIYKEVFNKSHEHFLKVVGFSKQLVDGKEYYCKDLG